MSRSLNKVILIGNLGSDPEVRSTPTGGRVAQFSLATSRTWNDPNGVKQEKTEWHRCVVWNTKGSSLADIVERYVKKGDKIYVEGRIEYRQWQDKDGQTRYSTEINVRELTMLGGVRADGGATGGGADDHMDAEPPRPRASVSAPASASANAPAMAAATAAVAAGEAPNCPSCGGAMWDNRASKRNPKAPDFKCRDKGCDGVIWPPRDGSASAAPARPAATATAPAGGAKDAGGFDDFSDGYDDDSDLPF
ncbi:MAG: single-stranded DNA-binding protein [Gemmatirosa sp.]|nr:single-stranded DNA-binding protein [Gemmatirosa sp.]